MKQLKHCIKSTERKLYECSCKDESYEIMEELLDLYRLLAGRVNP